MDIAKERLNASLSVYHIFRPCKLDATEVWSTTSCSWFLGGPLRYSTIDEP
ncbi:hypothetical protein L208DRAFT_1389859 [Tricholoma matsutake]|nr:hypothetical protein L208DRAFT_1389859 [Tricholoma matsutake 945]